VTRLYCKTPCFAPYSVASVRLFFIQKETFLLYEKIKKFFYFLVTMPLLKAQKKELAKAYSKKMEEGRNVTVLSFDKIPVNEVNKLRMNVVDAEGSLQVVKKRVFLKATDGSFDGLTLEQAGAAIMLLYSYNEQDEYAPLKAVNNMLKSWKKDKKEYEM
jgi:ribosomal protein L10